MALEKPVFTHPLARQAKVWPSTNADGLARDILVVVTTLVLDSSQENHKADKVTRLSNAARTWIADTKEADDFVLISRHRDWD